MKNRDKWQPSKYVYRRGKLVASRDRREIEVGSRLTADLTAGFYDRALRLHARGTLLDLGCGKVPLYGAYRDYVTDTICVDWENTQHKSEHVDFQCDLSKPLPFKDKEFDTIILSDVLEHVPEPEHLWKEMARILAAGGKILATLPFYYWLHEQPHDYYRFTEFALRRFAERSGLRLIQLEPIGGVPEILADIHAKQVQSLPLIGKGLATAIQCATKAFVRTPLGRRISGRTARSFPLAYGVIAERP